MIIITTSYFRLNLENSQEWSSKVSLHFIKEDFYHCIGTKKLSITSSFVEDEAGEDAEAEEVDDLEALWEEGSTPNYNADRFLCWNRIGIVKGIIDTKKEQFQPIRSSGFYGPSRVGSQR